jgi:hypothetical protein
MLYWLFTTYRNAALFAGIPLTCLGIVVPMIVAYTLGAGGQKSSEPIPSARQVWLLRGVSLIVGLAVIHVLILLLGGIAVDRSYARVSNPLVTILIGPPGFHYGRLGLFGFLTVGLGIGAGIGIQQLIRDGGWLREQMNRMRDPIRRRDEVGSAHFCYPSEFSRLVKSKEEGLVLLGAFYGKKGRGGTADDFYRLDAGPNRPYSGKGITFSLEDQARGMVVVGPPGTGKSQALILPVIAESMKLQQSVIVADPQGELTSTVIDLARVTGHQVVIHDPTSTEHPRYNLAGQIGSVAEAQAVAPVLIPQGSNNDFWHKSAQNLLAACLMRFDTLGDVLLELGSLATLSEKLEAEEDGAAYLSRSFAASANADGRLATSVVATLQASTLSAWADETVRRATEATDFSAAMLIDRPTILILKCPGRYRDVFGPYFGAILQKLLLDLDTIGEQSGGPLTRPVKIVLDEFPALGRLDSVAAGVNLFRKRRIAFLIAAQTLSQFELIYGRPAAEAMLAGLATQIYFGSCDAITARFVSDALGMTTERLPMPASQSTSGPLPVRQRRLMNAEEVITPPRGNCTIIHHTASANYAAQVVLLASLTRMYERKDWINRIAAAKREGQEPMVMQRPLFEGKRPEKLMMQSKPKTASLPDSGIQKEPYLPSLGDY